MNLQFSEGYIPATLVSNDAVILAPKTHEILFESPLVRILFTCVQPSETVPAHIHQWKSLLLIMRGSEFEVEGVDVHEQGYWPIGVYDLPSDKNPTAYKNLGSSEYVVLNFEIKE